MDKNSIVILPEGSEIPEDVEANAEIVGFLLENGSLKIALNKSEGPESFETMSEFFEYVGELKRKGDVQI